MTCIKMGSEESHFNVSLIVRGKVRKFEEKGRFIIVILLMYFHLAKIKPN